MFRLTFFFRILRSWKHVYHITPFRPTSYVLMRLKWLEFSNRERNWNKVKNFIFVGVETWIMPIGNANIHIQINVSVFINKLIFIFVLWIQSCSELKWRQNYDFSTIDISNSQIETLVSYSRSTNVNVNMSFPNSNFEGNFSTYVFGKSFWQYRELKIDCWTSRNMLCKKILIPS